MNTHLFFIFVAAIFLTAGCATYKDSSANSAAAIQASQMPKADPADVGTIAISCAFPMRSSAAHLAFPASGNVIALSTCRAPHLLRFKRRVV
jgi:hypothetical protein